MILALLSQVKGMALFDDGHDFYILDVERVEDEPQCANERLMAEFLDGANDLEHLDVEDLPALRKHLLIRKSREELLRATLILLDGERSKSVRNAAAERLRVRREYDEWEWVEGILMSTPLPEGSDPMGAARLPTPYQAFFVELLQAQEKIKTLRLAWNSLPHELFAFESREQTRARVVREGVFRSLLCGSARKETTPFWTALRAFSVSLERASKNKISQRSTYDFPLIWDALPWRWAWVETKWQRIEANLACEGARYWIQKECLATKKIEQAPSEAGFQQLFDSWTRHYSEVAESVDLICQLVDPGGKLSERGKEVSHMNFDSFAQKRERKASLSASISDFFGISATSHAMGNRSLVQERAAEIARTVLSLEAATDAREVATFLPDPSELKLLLNDNKQEIQPYLDALRGVFATYALDKVFKLNGCVVFIITFESKVGDGKKHAQSASLLNFHSRRAQSFDGFKASILGLLQKRLVADLRSGIPAEHCGWMPLDELGKEEGIDIIAVNSVMDDIREHLSGAGFASETFQEYSGDVRLNPKLAAPAELGRREPLLPFSGE